MLKINRPWGHYIEYMRSPFSVFKKLIILPSQSISYQSHNYRNEFWYIEAGYGILTLDDEKLDANEGSIFVIKIGQKHKIENTGSANLIIAEMQFGDLCDETDLIRYEDQYGRVKTE